jgi:hypothetical protein
MRLAEASIEEDMFRAQDSSDLVRRLSHRRSEELQSSSYFGWVKGTSPSLSNSLVIL